MVADLVVVVPTRSRPESLHRVVRAWSDTGAFDDGAEIQFLVDADDPRLSEYESEFGSLRTGQVSLDIMPTWLPLVPKLNSRVVPMAGLGHFAIGFAGDDHLPRTPGWVAEYVSELRSLRAGIVYPDDGYQRERLPTSWAMTTDVIRELGRMVPANVDHLYCDNAVMDLGRAADCITYLPHVLVEHMHPAAGKADVDRQYLAVNSPEQYALDRAIYVRWHKTQLPMDAGIIRTLREKRDGNPY